MRFRVVPRGHHLPPEEQDTGYLLTDNWDDFGYQTLYILFYFDNAGNRHQIGSVKIGQYGLEEGRPKLPTDFDELDERFFSLGQDVEYYSSLMGLEPGGTATALLSALNDIAANEEIYQRALGENVTGVSLLRFVNLKTIEGQYRRILDGGAELSEYEFDYEGPKPPISGISPLRLKFQVIPESRPPTNVHVLIGPNGVGKTYLLNAMTRALVSSEPSREKDGLFTSSGDSVVGAPESPFANILSVTFSAFDDFQNLGQLQNATATQGVRYTNVGLREWVQNNQNDWVTVTRAPEELAKSFSDSAELCVQGAKAPRWREALATLDSDPLFREAEVVRLADVDAEEESFFCEARKLYRGLSSGHKIVLLTLTKLVENVEEKTLVLIDEPEAHLHPPLLAAFVRALSDLLINRNGVAIIATHSPVVLQEVPRSCVWKIIRHGNVSQASRPEIETFAENVGILTKQIFGLEVTRSGFHRMLLEAAEDASQIQEVLEKFDNEVGSEGRALISGMIASQNADEAE